MSETEDNGLVFGILPVIISAIKAYTKVSRSLRTYRRFSQDVKLVHLQLKSLRDIFINEVCLFLRLVEDERGAKDMLEDETDARWTSKELNDKFNRLMKDDFVQCRNHIESSEKTVEAIGNEMKKFDFVMDQKTEDESIKSAIKRLRTSVPINFDKLKCEKSLKNLQDQNAHLSLLRARIGDFEQQESCTESTCVDRKVLPPHIHSIRTASQKLHEALSDAWRCDDIRHGDHCAKLCLDADVQAEVRLDLAISCHYSCQGHDRKPAREPPIWLYVQSISIDTTAGGGSGGDLATSAKRPRDSTPQAGPELSMIPASPPKMESPPEHHPSRACRRRRIRKQVRFDDLEPAGGVTSNDPALTNDISDAIARTVAQQATPWIDLCKTKNFCHYLKQNLKICGNSVDNHCVGYLETPRMYRHMFYLQDKYVRSEDHIEDLGQSALYRISDIMDQDAVEILTIPDQLKLAHKTALAILQYSSTPWLSDRWTLRDLGYFGHRRVLNENALKTLHLSSCIPSPGSHNVSGKHRVKGTADAITEEEQDYFGVHNTTLFSLGIALLEIAHWKPLDKQGYTSEIVAARRLARLPTKFGPKYEDLANKCLRCDFGFGNDLGKRELQAAVYTDIICPLERMIKSLTLD